jgi:hypothetical protein
MDAHRFDALTRAFGGRLSRRNALKASGIGAAATFLSAAGLRSSRAQTDDPEWYALVRRYSATGNVDQLQQTLNQGYLPQISQEPGFVQYLVIATEQNQIVTVTVFDNQADQQAAENREATWIQQNLAELLPSPAEVLDGDVISYIGDAEKLGGFCPEPTPEPTEEPATPTVTPAPCTGEGCDCATGTESPCDEGLVCCPNEGSEPGGPGTCRAEEDCGCTGQGCHCNAGVEGACDEGLICCQEGDAVPGGAGTCQPEDQCGTEPCTGDGCQCDHTDPNSCDAGLECCPVQSGWVCGVDCLPEPCTGSGCDCDPTDENSCDQGLVCCETESGATCAAACG